MKNSIQWIRKIHHQSKKRSRSAEPGPRLNCFQDNSKNDKLTKKCNYDKCCDECGGFTHEREWKSSEEIYR